MPFPEISYKLMEKLSDHADHHGREGVIWSPNFSCNFAFVRSFLDYSKLFVL